MQQIAPARFCFYRVAGGVTITESANALFAALKTTERFFIRDSVVVRAITQALDVMQLQALEPQALRSIIEGLFEIQRRGKKEPEFAICSGEDARAFLASDARFQLPHIARLLRCPVIDCNGNICRKGYHAHINGGTYIVAGESATDEIVESADDAANDYTLC